MLEADKAQVIAEKKQALIVLVVKSDVSVEVHNFIFKVAVNGDGKIMQF